ncbi:MAG: phosphoenolpyruvate carboxykinase domain-containing protein, partial [Desulfobacteraceae bacterium]|jgi:phosphoenolpyruvate carboxykinase (GTP)
MPQHQDIHWKGLDFDPETFYALMAVDRDQAKKEAREQEDQFDLFFDRLPKEFTHHRELFKSRIWRSPRVWELARAVF